MPYPLSDLITAIDNEIKRHADEISELDRCIGDGDHLTNLQRGIDAVKAISEELEELDWSSAFTKIGMTLLSTMGGASGSLYGTLFIAMGKSAKQGIDNSEGFATIFRQGVDAVAQRGKASIGEKTMLDTLVPVAQRWIDDSTNNLEYYQLLTNLSEQAIAGMQSTRDMLATKGRASFLGDRVIGHIDAGARSSQLIICAITEHLLTKANTNT